MICKCREFLRRRGWARALLGSLTALAALNLFCAFYFNPAGYEQDAYRSTDTVRTPGRFTSRATEGFAAMRMDENGYNNAAVPGEDGVSVLIMGSSHMEALNVAQEENTASLLNAALRARGEAGCAYNIGISAHTLPRCMANFARAVDRFAPSVCVVVETDDLLFSKKALDAALSDTNERLSATNRTITRALRYFPLAVALYEQYSNANAADAAAPSGDAEGSQEIYDSYEAYLTDAFARLRAESDVPVILLHHPHLRLNADGTATADVDARLRRVFASAAARSGVIFVDMTDAFLENFRANHTLPHGFANTEAGVGHLNARGHRMIAEALLDVIVSGRLETA